MSETPKPPVLAVQNVKGGVGKTTIAVNLAAHLAAKHGKKVLLIDADPQCNASLYLLSDDEFLARTARGNDREKGNLYDVFHSVVRYFDVVTGKPYGPKPKKDRSPIALVRSCAGGGSLSLACGSPQLFEVQEMAAEVVVGRIKRWLSTAGAGFHQVIIDCPPSISSLSLSALKAADDILVPMPADRFSIVGLPLLVEALKEYKKVLSIKAKIAGVVISMFPEPGAPALARADKHALAIADLCASKDLGVPCLSGVISRNAAYPQSFETQVPIPFSPTVDSELAGELEDLAVDLKLVGSRR